ncbi:STAS domain-containing protein [Actinophytocola sp.]|uniref:STAS domain-containing protein n=1 Tax=Actinophytocola sp. TaxID=1872138 RepID=UPI0038999843
MRDQNQFGVEPHINLVGEVATVTDTNEALFWVRREQHPDAVVVRAGGELDAFTVDQLTKQLREAEDAVTPAAPVLLDLTGITYLSSAGVATLVIHTQRCTELNSRLCVIANQPAVLRPIALTGADNNINVAPTLEKAMARNENDTVAHEQTPQ